MALLVLKCKALMLCYSTLGEGLAIIPYTRLYLQKEL